MSDSGYEDEFEEEMDEGTMHINTGIINTEHAGRRVWLVKVPDYLAERLAELDESGLDLGVVKISAEPTGPQIKLLLSSEGPCGDLPQEYNLQLSKCDQTMHVFSESLSGPALSIEGKVEQECQLKPVLNEHYRDVMRKRDEAANKPKRTIQMVDQVTDNIHMGHIPHMKEQEMIMRRKRRFEPELRRERLPKQDVVDMLFRAFERSPHWSFKALEDQTRQPAAYLKEVLEEIAVYNMRGPYKSLYELRPEYKNQ